MRCTLLPLSSSADLEAGNGARTTLYILEIDLLPSTRYVASTMIDWSTFACFLPQFKFLVYCTIIHT